MGKISNYAADSSPSADDIIITVDLGSGENKKVTLSDLSVLVAQNLKDSSGNELLGLESVASAVNYPNLKPSATGDAVELEALGDDSDIDFSIVPKGTGAVSKNGNPIDWWEELGRVSASSGTTMEITSFSAKKYLKIIVVDNGTSNNGTDMIFNADTSANYALSRTLDGSAFSSQPSLSSMEVMGNYNGLQVSYLDMINISNTEKIASVTWISGPKGGTRNSAAQIPVHGEYAAKWVNTSAQITRVKVTRRGGSYASGSELIVLGHD